MERILWFFWIKENNPGKNLLLTLWRLSNDAYIDACSPREREREYHFSRNFQILKALFIENFKKIAETEVCCTPFRPCKGEDVRMNRTR